MWQDLRKLSNVKQVNLLNYVLVAVMTHGGRTESNVDMLHCYDDEYEANFLINSFESLTS